MRSISLSSLSVALCAAVLSLSACENFAAPLTNPDEPANVTYELIPSGNPAAPAGVLLSWDVPRSGRANSFNVYGRNSNAGAWQLRATTTSPTFHDAGIPQAQYYITTRDANGNEIAQSAVLVIDLATQLPAPLGFRSISLNAAVQLAWSSNAVGASNGTFDHYAIYSASYDGSRGVCSASWVVEGSTVADAFLAGNLVNGVTRCYAVSAITRDGHESQLSDAHFDTPRPDAHNAFVYATQVKPDSAGFLFYDEVAKTVGAVASAARSDLDFTLDRHGDGTLWISPARTGSGVVLYSAFPVGDLTAVDRAPSTGFAATSVQAQPGYAYVFRLVKADGVHFAALRVAFLTASYAVFDWSYQTSPGNAELSRAPIR